MMCEAARSLNTLTLPTCPDGDFTIECASSGDEAAGSYFSTLHTVDSQPKVSVTLADSSEELDDSAETSNESIDTQRSRSHLRIPSIYTTISQ